ncbi:PQQ-binding-like beta-propeller repeat protein [Streptomyces sp. NPDC026665]|uniref:outer membrane protein assembly factor BamB family protein n=1 Tax=Streptomyces sp. NPDC026665 TaxID=3154798 RepID=UPI0033F48FDA
MHWLDAELNVIRSSCDSAVAQAMAAHPIYALQIVGDWIITRDKIGNISRWDADSLRLLDRLDAKATADRSLLMEGEQPSLTMLRGIGVWQGKIYVDNGYYQLVILDLETFTVERIVLWPHGYDMLEWFCTDAPGVQAVADRNGRVQIGDLEALSFPTVVKIDSSNVHRLVYDRRHNRYWATLDGGLDQNLLIANGVLTMSLNGTVQDRMLYARNDVEALAFSPDFDKAYVGGFDGELMIFDNAEPTLKLFDRIGGFSHQLIDITVDPAGLVYVLTQDGDITVCTAEGKFVRRLGFERQCVWEIQPLPGEDNALIASTDDGSCVVRLAETVPGHPALIPGEHYTSGLGFTRRLVVADDGWAGVFWPRTVRRSSGDGSTLWEHELPGIVHTLAISPDHDRVLVASNAGAFEFDARTGEQLAVLDHLPTSAWVCGYLPDGRRLVGARNGRMVAFHTDGTESWTVDLEHYPKRLFVEEDLVRVTGGVGVKEYRIDADKEERQFVELLDNTAENAVLIDGTLCVVTYGFQLAAYDYGTGQILALNEDLPDFAKGIAALRGSNGQPYIVVGGRGGYLRLFRLDRGDTDRILTPLRDLWLPGVTSRYPSLPETESASQ